MSPISPLAPTPTWLRTQRTPLPHATILRRLRATLRKAGFHVFDTVHHHTVAPPAAEPMPPTSNVYFGLPAQGTALMVADPAWAARLPMCVSVQTRATPSHSKCEPHLRRPSPTRRRAHPSVLATCTFYNPFDVAAAAGTPGPTRRTRRSRAPRELPVDCIGRSRTTSPSHTSAALPRIAARVSKRVAATLDAFLQTLPW